MPELTNLPGVKRLTVPCKMVSSVSKALMVTRRTATTAAGDNGAISVWIDDAGKYRAEFSRWLCRKGGIEATSKRALRNWLREWWPKMQ